MYQYKKSNDGNVTFPVLQSWNPNLEKATIAAQVNGKRVLCRIAVSVLKRKYQNEANPMATITAHRHEIEAAAEKLIKAKAYDEEGAINIRYQDL